MMMSLRKIVVEFELNSVEDVERAANLVFIGNECTYEVQQQPYKGSTRAEVAVTDFQQLTTDIPALIETWPDELEFSIRDQDGNIIDPVMAEREPEIVVEVGASLRIEAGEDRR